MPYIKENNTLYPSNSGVEEVKKLENKIYLLLEDPIRGFKLIEQEDFIIPTKIYGDLESLALRYVETFSKREDNTTGVLLSGDKGNGKSLLAKLTCSLSNVPVIIVTEYFKNFISIISSLTEPCVIFVDEFDKIYDTEEKQNELLSLLDGVFNFKKLFLFTSNKKDANPFLINRPGRIFYHRHFSEIESNVILEVIDDLLINKEFEKELIHITKILGSVNMDSLLSLIEEINRYNESPKIAIKNLNISMEDLRYKLTLIVKNKYYTETFIGHPLREQEYSIYYSKKDDGNERYYYWDREEYVVKIDDYYIEYGESGLVKMRHKEKSDILIFERVEKEKLSNSYL